MSVHPTALVAAGAAVDASAEIGPFCSVAAGARLGAGVRLHSHVVIADNTTLEAGCVVHPFAVLGGVPQDKKYRDEPGRLVVGAQTVVREGVTANIGTSGGSMETRIGRGCLLMAYAHVAHDCCLGDAVILANGVSLAGHVQVDDHAILGGLAAVHQFCRIGTRAFIGGGAMVAADVPPFCVAQGDRAQLAGLNLVGLKRALVARPALGALHRLYRCIFHDAATLAAGLERARGSDWLQVPEAAQLFAFVADRSARGVAAPRRRGGASAAPATEA